MSAIAHQVEQTIKSIRPKRVYPSRAKAGVSRYSHPPEVRAEIQRLLDIGYMTTGQIARHVGNGVKTHHVQSMVKANRKNQSSL